MTDAHNLGNETGTLEVAPSATRLRLVAVIAAAWALLYAVYRFYHGLGGTWGVPGIIREDAVGTFRAINLFAATVLVIAAAAPFLLVLLRNTRLRAAGVVACWIIAVGCLMHAFVDIIQRILSLQGVISVDYPATLWAEVDRRAADLQDLFGNEPWFLIEGVLIWVLGYLCVRPAARRIYTISSIVAVSVLVVVGVLAAVGTLGRFIVG